MPEIMCEEALESLELANVVRADVKRQSQLPWTTFPSKREILVKGGKDRGIPGEDASDTCEGEIQRLKRVDSSRVLDTVV